MAQAEDVHLFRTADTPSVMLQVCGRPDVWGDGITPVECAHLEGGDFYFEKKIYRPRCLFAKTATLEPYPTNQALNLISQLKGVGSYHAGAKQITLDGVYHSPLGAVLPAADGSKPGRPWYGSPECVDGWVHEIWRDADELSGERDSLSHSLCYSWDALLWGFYADGTCAARSSACAASPALPRQLAASHLQFTGEDRSPLQLLGRVGTSHLMAVMCWLQGLRRSWAMWLMTACYQTRKASARCEQRHAGWHQDTLVLGL